MNDQQSSKSAAAVKAVVLIIALIVLTPFAFAQSSDATLLFRPHCTETDQTLCAQFDVLDPMTLTTVGLKAGDTLDLDIVFMNPTQEAVSTMRVWLSYDADALEGKTIEISPAFPTIAPGQSDFAPSSGYVKIAAAAKEGAEPRDAILPLARVIFTVKETATGPVPISFYDRLEGTEGHTYVTTVSAPAQNAVPDLLGSLLVNVETMVGTSAPSASAVSSAATSSVSAQATSSAAPSTQGSAAFELLQVQGLKVGTQESKLYVTWDPLSHPRLQGYNVYYGQESGKYIQRRSVSVAARGTVIHDLPPGTKYFVSVRAVDNQNRESAFSEEASVEIGNSPSATPPIVGALEAYDEVSTDAVAPENPLTSTVVPADIVPGNSGASSGIALLIVISASIGTLFAVRRQFAASQR